MSERPSGKDVWFEYTGDESAVCAWTVIDGMIQRGVQIANEHGSSWALAIEALACRLRALGMINSDEILDFCLEAYRMHESTLSSGRMINARRQIRNCFNCGSTNVGAYPHTLGYVCESCAAVLTAEVEAVQSAVRTEERDPPIEFPRHKRWALGTGDVGGGPEL